MTVTPKCRGRHHHGDLRRALLDAVAEIVLAAGPEAVTLRECARRAGVSHSAAAPHFGDKRGLLTAFAIGWPLLQVFGYTMTLRMAKGDPSHDLVKVQVILHYIALALLLALVGRAL